MAAASGCLGLRSLKNSEKQHFHKISFSLMSVRQTTFCKRQLGHNSQQVKYREASQLEFWKGVPFVSFEIVGDVSPSSPFSPFPSFLWRDYMACQDGRQEGWRWDRLCEGDRIVCLCLRGAWRGHPRKGNEWLAGAWRGAKELGYLKSLQNRELRSYPQVSNHILDGELKWNRS